MPEGFARIAAVSLPVHLGDVEANEREIMLALERLRTQGVQAAEFPELSRVPACFSDPDAVRNGSAPRYTGDADDRKYPHTFRFPR